VPEVNYMEPVGPGNVKGPLLIFEDRLVELFGYSGRLIDKYSGAINGYREALGGHVRVFSLVTPTQIEFMPEKYKSVSNSEYDAIQRVKETLADGVVPVDAYSSIAAHATEYIYFRTDHHWTARGAYYAYLAFADAAGFTPKSLDEYEELEYPNFLGYLYSLAPSASLKSNPDTIYAYKYKGDLDTSQPLLRSPGEGGSSTYSIFLGGDKPHMAIETSVKNGRTAVIIKNSYGNAFIPWLAPHYENIVVLDPRSFTGSALDVINQHSDVDLIFCSYALTLSSENFIDQIAKIK
jgi:hypothetical protein